MTPKKNETKPAPKSATESKPSETKATETKPAEPTQPVATVAVPPPAPVAAPAPVKAPKFVRALELQVAAFVQAQKLAKPSDDLALFVSWSRSNPPAEKVAAPAGDTATGRVFAYCDQMKASGKPFTRKEVIDALTAQGLNPATVSTQFQRWSKARGAVAA